MTNTLPAFEENSKPVCHGSPRPLLELASLKTALNAWLQKFNEYFPADYNDYIDVSKLDFNFEGSSAVPPGIQKMIDSNMFPISTELNSWYRYLKSIAKTLSYDQIYARLNLVVFGGNGTVHFKDSFANFLEDDSLNNIARFEIACVNCVEEKIDFFWPLVSNEVNVDDLRFDDDFMLYYWICRKRSELDRISLQEFSCIERLMFDKCRQNLIDLAMEYFLTLLNPDDRIAELREPSKFRGNGNLTFIFPNIDGPTQRLILSEYPAKILYGLVINLSPVEYSTQCFHHIRYLITPECFCREVIINIINFIDVTAAQSLFKGRSKKFVGLWYKWVEIALEQIWLITPPHLKEYGLENLSKILLAYNRKSNIDCFLDFGRDIRFLLAVLSDADFQFRNKVWIENWPFWIVGVPPSQFQELMGLCLMKPEAIEEFKSTFVHTEVFRSYCNRLICQGYFIQLDEFLNCLYSNQNFVLETKKRIFTNETGIFYKKCEVVEKYVNYIDNSFSNNIQAADFKENVICSKPVLETLFNNGIFSGNNLKDLIHIVSLFVLPEKHAKVKNMFLELFRNKIVNGRLPFFNEYVWNQFLIWCTDSNEELVDIFMKSLPIDVVFEAVFFENAKIMGYSGCMAFIPLNKFLIWYFKSKSVSQNYVREKVEYYGKMDAAEIERIFGQSKWVVTDMMEWMKNWSST